MKNLLMTGVASIAIRAFMNDATGQCETVLIVGDGNGPYRINADDFDEDKGHVLHKPTKAEKAVQAAPVAVAGNQLLPDNTLPIPPAPSAPAFAAPEGGSQPSDPVPPSNPSPDTKAVIKDGKKFYVTDLMGVKLTIDGIDAKGYATDADAWEAIKALPH